MRFFATRIRIDVGGVSLAAQIDGIAFFVVLPQIFFCYRETDNFASARLAIEGLIQQGWDMWPGGIELTPSGKIVPPGWSGPGHKGKFSFDESVNRQIAIKILRTCFAAAECADEREAFAEYEVWVGRYKVGLFKHVVNGSP